MRTVGPKKQPTAKSSTRGFIVVEVAEGSHIPYGFENCAIYCQFPDNRAHSFGPILSLINARRHRQIN
jgi:hypothetical protein